MADSDDPAAMAARLEVALDRIARLIDRPQASPVVTARLDALIAQIRRMLQRAEE